MHEDETPNESEHRAIQGWTRRERYIMLVAALTTFIVATVSLVGSWQTGSNLTSYVKCQSEWNTFLHSSLEARTNVGAEATIAMDNFINAIAEAKSNTDVRAALDKYKEARAKQLKTQQENPLPPPPSEVCVI